MLNVSIQVKRITLVLK